MTRYKTNKSKAEILEIAMRKFYEAHNDINNMEDMHPNTQWYLGGAYEALRSLITELNITEIDEQGGQALR